jgi:hypothetical protein
VARLLVGDIIISTNQQRNFCMIDNFICYKNTLIVSIMTLLGIKNI